MDTYVEQNAKAWDWEVGRNNIWTDGCTQEQIDKARKGELDMVLSPFKKVPASWVSDIAGKKVLALASGGGQQAVLLALAGAQVTVFDVSKKQLAQDASYAEKLNLDIQLVRGDMRDLSCFEDASFDLIYNPTSSCFIDDVKAMYSHCYRILRTKGYFLTSITNPVLYMFDEKRALKNKLRVKYTLPYSDLNSLSAKQLEKRMKNHDTVEFSHTLEDLLGGVTDCGFHITDLYTDTAGCMMMDSYVHDCYLALRACKN
ncbi:class I SAM-dependent methyltransferase [Sphaerochaeta globosa]|uniref:Methyltransferase type 11 n=1 Tax=Sphaerochaeta globosa (strain ATCC BAA-1886 / DSM 22777 / Buddy) TaxID=158189 RepID=F0RW31_SPHGB|nr:class I SAM-dependent methyltransferase [Sphaerochaeta globosa]ADY13317.1 Methyltransferase type 11 [Sphaerochaeta globosa str. Buddy]